LVGVEEAAVGSLVEALAAEAEARFDVRQMVIAAATNTGILHSNY